MKTQISRLWGLLLVVTASAVAPTHADEVVEGGLRVTPLAPAASLAEPAPALRPTSPGGGAGAQVPANTVSNSTTGLAAPSASTSPGGGAGAQVLADNVSNSTTGLAAPSASTSPGDRPILLLTKPAEGAAEAELTEDLKVMDKLLDEEVSSAAFIAARDVLAGQTFVAKGRSVERPRLDRASAMGIRLVMLGRAQPMYVEGGGAVFSTAVTWPLARAEGSGAAAAGEKPRNPASAWERAKRELNGGSDLSLSATTWWQPAAPTYSQERVDALIDAIVRVLPEATNMRHLKPDEFVFVTVAGSDDRGKPVRLTLKALKSDIDDAAAGKLKPDEFKQRVARRIG